MSAVWPQLHLDDEHQLGSGSAAKGDEQVGSRLGRHDFAEVRLSDGRLQAIGDGNVEDIA